ncbi:hypothetical protein OF001_U390017 [Pseudomonas sp. OF001]|nr:hypothetical protein OF001_U390017 [Pseudomonas sp. OF001]
MAPLIIFMQECESMTPTPSP